MRINGIEISRPGSRPHQRGSAVIVILILVVILLLYLAGNIRTLYSLHREIKLIDRQQTRRLEATFPRTNSVAGTNAVQHRPDTFR